MNERMKELRKKLKLSGDKFGEKLGISKSAVSSIEKGINALTEQNIKAICREFNVNEEWLRFGTGEMFIITKEHYLSELVQEFNLDKLDIAILETYLLLDEDKRAILKNYIKEVSEKCKAGISPGTVFSPDKENKEQTADELAKEKAAFLKMAEEQFDKEKEASKAYSAKESDVS